MIDTNPFLPVDKFWMKPRPSRFNQFALGFIGGFGLASLLFALFANLIFSH